MNSNTNSFQSAKDTTFRKPYIYAIVRNDLSHEQKITQVGHATWHAAQSFSDADTIPNFITLAVDNEQDLIAAAERLKRYGIEHEMFYEPDFGPQGFSSICTRIVSSSKERKIMWKWSLYKSTKETSNAK